MRVLVGNFTAGGMSGGYLRYLKEMLPRLAARSDIQAITTVNAPRVAKVVEAALPELCHLSRGSLAAGLRQADVLFLPAARPLVRRFLDRRPPLVVLLQNMEPLAVPYESNSMSDSLRNTVRWVHSRAAVRQAQRTLVLNGTAAEFLTQRWGVPASRIGLVRHGVTTVPLGEEHSIPGLPSWFYFAAGSIRPARGLDELLRAYARCVSFAVNIPALVVAGEPTKGALSYQKRLMALAQALDIDDRIHWLGHLSAAKMAVAFRSAVAYVTASHAEMLPITALEAMAYGCRCVSTDLPPMPEVFGDAATYFSSRNVDDLANAMYSVTFEDAETTRRYVDRGLARILAFNWDNAAATTAYQLSRALDNSPISGSRP